MQFGYGGNVVARGETVYVICWNPPSIIDEFDAWFLWALRKHSRKLKGGAK